MTDLERLCSWLQTYPCWQDTLLVDFTEGKPRNTGLFPKGLEEVARHRDILGNLQLDCRYRFALYRQTVGQADGADNAQWLLDFQNWVQQQSASGLAPRFGDEPSRERIRAEKGYLLEGKQPGTYVVTLIAEFMKIYEVN